MVLCCNFHYILIQKSIEFFLFSTGGQSSNGQTVGDLVSTSQANNGPPPSHGIPTGSNHHMATMNAHRLPMMPLPHGMQFRPPFGHPHGPGGPQFFPRGPAVGMHGDR